MRAPAANDDDARLQILFHSLFLFTLSLSLSLVSSPLSILVVVRNPDTRLKFRHNRRTASNRKHHPPLKPPSATISLSNSPKTTNPERKTAPAPKTSHPQTRSSPFLLNLSLPLSLSLGRDSSAVRSEMSNLLGAWKVLLRPSYLRRRDPAPDRQQQKHQQQSSAQPASQKERPVWRGRSPQ